ncbi:hypothetical protein GCM10018777_31590 [Streptomyces albogriseolus]|uniref:hypothetical protein n=1 Tax=Streptomyces TaxID=1883 RepID=UPI001673BA81|nr:hypothetical protein [Streptomyces viridodiastaticus]GHG15516.1 hypothetical protein GCM10018777_31590 [Streptomyces viridodiastaticus]
MKNVPTNVSVAIARQLLAETDGVDYDECSERDLCRLIGRFEFALASLITAIEDGGQ